MIYTRQWLQDQIRSYLKDRSLTLAELDTFIDVSVSRLCQVLECTEMETIITGTVQAVGAIDGGNAGSVNTQEIDGGDAFNSGEVVLSPAAIPLSSNHKRIVVVQYLRDGDWYALRSVPKHEAAAYKVEGQPCVYYIEDSQVFPIPRKEGNARVIALEFFELPDTGSHPVLQAYPFLFLNAALAEAYDWKQDEVANQRYENKWIGDAEAVTTLYRTTHQGETLSMRAI